ncbi:FG-GAP repeat domain-containing protein [Ruegeria sp. SCP11]|uniref:FG-GAP repeat domain-containing protein n=1 Tax=Ruegeria sp. SCP11 TaxID=3141378 RepID=UPI00333A6D13
MPDTIPNDPIESDFTATLALGRNEAEKFSFDSGFKIQTNPHASDDSFLQAQGDISRAGGLFEGESGYFDLTVGYFDETDGVSYMELVVNGIVVDSFQWDSTTGSRIVTPDGLQERTVLSVWLNPGDSVVLRGRADSGEPLRTDYLDIAPSADGPPPPSPSKPFIVEAETLDILSGFRVVENPNASGDAFLQAREGAEARALYTVEKAGTFDLTIGYFDETDGVSSMRVLLNGNEIDSFEWDSTDGSDLANASSRAERTIKNLTLEKDDQITLIGKADGGEPLRTDFLRFEPSADGPPPPSPGKPFIVEAETLDILSGFRVVENPNASGDAFLQAREGAEASALYTVEKAGTFDFTIGYFDETDGVSSMRVLLNGKEIDSFEWDSTDGSDLASASSRAERTIKNLTLEKGDQITLVGKANGGEPLRTDFLRFEPVSTDPSPEPTPDVWYIDNGEVVLGLNDGTGKFTTRKTGITPGENGTLAADFDGDGHTDFLTVNVTVPPEMGVTDEFIFTTTLFSNDGTGIFPESKTSEIKTSSLFPFLGLGGLSLAAKDAGDIDGDGDQDILLFDENGDTAFLLENDGTGSFSLLSRSEIVSAASMEGLIGDFDGNTAGDIVALTGPTASSVSIYLNDGTGNLTSSGSTGSGPETQFDGQILDLDGDGDEDVLFVANGEGRGIYTLLNDGTGETELGNSPSVEIDEVGLVGLVEGGNFDGDAAIEVVSAGASDDNLDPGLRVYEVADTGSGKEFVLQSFDPSITGNVQAAADYDGDGDLDLLIASDASPGTLSLLLNDGDANFTDAGVVLPTDLVADEFYFFDDTAWV